MRVHKGGGIRAVQFQVEQVSQAQASSALILQGIKNYPAKDFADTVDTLLSGMDYVQTQRVGPVRMMVQCRGEKLATCNFDKLKSKLSTQNLSII
eukprot:9795521-Prorocentrum_lima.AAC.1